ncbi:MAG: hypothetical protein J7K72_00040 [Candidatus Aenigmarchaeota archaeon]|nr:hypothetical protein [Candidatus Aenigmarchaeota archaeon]
MSNGNKESRDELIRKVKESWEKIKKMRPEIIEKTIQIEIKLDRIIIEEFKIKDDFNFLKIFLYGISPINLKKKIEILENIENGKYKKTGKKLRELARIRNIFVHSPEGAFTEPVLISKRFKPVNAEEEFNKFMKIYKEQLLKPQNIITKIKASKCTG